MSGRSGRSFSSTFTEPRTVAFSTATSVVGRLPDSAAKWSNLRYSSNVFRPVRGPHSSNCASDSVSMASRWCLIFSICMVLRFRSKPSGPYLILLSSITDLSSFMHLSRLCILLLPNAACVKAVQPRLSFANTFAPACRRSFRPSIFLRSAATINRVLP